MQLRMKPESRCQVFSFTDKHLYFTLPLFTQVSKWVPSIIILGGGGGGEVTL